MQFAGVTTYASKITVTGCQVSNQQRAFNRLSLWEAKDWKPTFKFPDCGRSMSEMIERPRRDRRRRTAVTLVAVVGPTDQLVSPHSPAAATSLGEEGRHLAW